MDTIGGTSFVPDVFIDVTDVIDLKAEMYRTHASQLEWGKSIFGRDTVDNILMQNEMRGIQSGFRYAEAFQLLDYPIGGAYELSPSSARLR